MHIMCNTCYIFTQNRCCISWSRRGNVISLSLPEICLDFPSKCHLCFVSQRIRKDIIGKVWPPKHEKKSHFAVEMKRITSRSWGKGKSCELIYHVYKQGDIYIKNNANVDFPDVLSMNTLFCREPGTKLPDYISVLSLKVLFWALPYKHKTSFL